MGHVASRLDPFGDGVTVGARLLHGLRQTSHGSKIILDAPDGTPRCKAQVEAHFYLFGDSANLHLR